MGYKHLTKEQRYTIDALLQTPMSLREIGEVIGVSTGTVSREIRRNCDMRGYHRYRWRRRDSLYSSRGIIQDRVDISLRPLVVEEKRRFGDFEIDTMIGRNHKGAIMTTKKNSHAHTTLGSGVQTKTRTG